MTAAARRMALTRDTEGIPPLDGQWTIADFMRLENPPGYHYELIEGVLSMSPSPNLPHQRAVGTLYRRLSAFVEKRRLGEVFIAPLDVVIDKGKTQTVVEPDIIFVSNERKAILNQLANIQGTPDLLVEVLSPGSRRRDRKEKFDLYMSRNVLEYWLVDPDEGTIEVWVQHKKAFVKKGTHRRGHRARSQVLAGFSVAVSDVCAS